MSYESYEAYVNVEVDDEFREFCAKHDIELNWRDTYEE